MSAQEIQNNAIVEKKRKDDERAGTPLESGERAISLKRLDLATCEKIEVKFCRAHVRPVLFSKGPIASLGQLIDGIHSFARPNLDRHRLWVAAWYAMHRHNSDLPIRENQFGVFLNGKHEVSGKKTRHEWEVRTEIILKLLILGNSPNAESDPATTEIMNRILRFFLPRDETKNRVIPTERFFIPERKRHDMPSSDREVGAELRAIAYCARTNGAKNCRIVRVSGWQGFPLLEPKREIGDLTIAAVLCGARADFVVLDIEAGSPAAKSAQEFVNHATIQIEDSRKDSRNRQRSNRDTDSGVRLHKIPSRNLSIMSRQGRPISNFLSRNFRWAYYSCPDIDAHGNVSTTVFRKSLVVIRTLPTHEYAFCPSAEEVEEFETWLNLVAPH